MQIKKKDIEKRILEFGREEFYANGYARASILRIAEAAEIPGANLYRYFDGKKGLFDALVKPVYVFLPRFVADLAGTTTVLTMPLEQFSAFIAKELHRVFSKYGKEILVLFYGSEGTEYSDFKDKIADQMFDIVAKRNFGMAELSQEDTIMTRVISDGFFNALIALLKRDYNNNDYTELIRKITLFYFNEIKKRGQQ